MLLKLIIYAKIITMPSSQEAKLLQITGEDLSTTDLEERGI
jgi:hypothetical protein